ncbi:MAG: helix-turn-helix domain-containing protein [Bacteroidota bacterium]
MVPALAFCGCEIRAKMPVSEKYPKELLTIGDHIRKRRLDLTLSQKELAEQLGVSSLTIWDWEKNRAYPRCTNLPAVISFLGYKP